MLVEEKKNESLTIVKVLTDGSWQWEIDEGGWWGEELEDWDGGGGFDLRQVIDEGH